MAENETEKPMPEEPEGAVDEGVQDGAGSLRAEDHEITVILPDGDSVEDTEEQGDVEADVTETVPLGSVEEGDDVFVLLPDGDDEAIPMVETEEVQGAVL